MRKLAVFDTEGICVRTGGTNRSKKTTIWTRKAHLIVWDCLNKEIVFDKGWKIKMPVKFNDLDEKTKSQWRHTHPIHECQWDGSGTPYAEVLEEIKKEIKDSEVWAKGKFLEDRFLNNKGMYGESICQRNWCGREIYVNELNGHGIKKFDDSMYQYYKWVRGLGMYILTGSIGEIVIRNYEQNLPLPHSPERECMYFLGELLKYKKKFEN
jgi:hypothetical protein